MHAVYDEIADVLADLGLAHVDGVLFDLGVSSMQLDVRERGFSYAEDAPLDMRMDDSDRRAPPPTSSTPTPSRSSPGSCGSTARSGSPGGSPTGSSGRARREPFTRSARLVELVRDAIPAADPAHRGHPAKRTFQALRIEVNDELGRAAPGAAGRHRRDRGRRPGRRDVLPLARGPDHQAAVRPRHSRSDVPPDLPVVPEAHQPLLRLLTRGAEKADEAEVAENPRARSVRLRAAERVREGAVA